MPIVKWPIPIIGQFADNRPPANYRPTIGAPLPSTRRKLYVAPSACRALHVDSVDSVLDGAKHGASLQADSS